MTNAHVAAFLQALTNLLSDQANGELRFGMAPPRRHGTSIEDNAGQLRRRLAQEGERGNISGDCDRVVLGHHHGEDDQGNIADRVVLGHHHGDNDDLSRLAFANAAIHTNLQHPTEAPGGTGGGEISIRTRDLGVISPPSVPRPPPGLQQGNNPHTALRVLPLRSAFNDAITAFHARAANPTGAPTGEAGGGEENSYERFGVFRHLSLGAPLLVCRSETIKHTVCTTYLAMQVMRVLVLPIAAPGGHCARRQTH